MSHLAFFESRGKVYKDGGVTTNALTILQKYGVTCVRLRLFTSSAAQAAADPYNYINNLDYTVPLAQRVKNAGLQFMLDFHYSDTWASPVSRPNRQLGRIWRSRRSCSRCALTTATALQHSEWQARCLITWR